jgi:hypothetical protein
MLPGRAPHIRRSSLNLLKFEGKSWRLKEAAERVAKRASAA